jgi:GH18 family chitinase
MSYAEATLTYWADRGLPAAQGVLGVPFYSRPHEVSYRDLVQADPAAAEADEVEYYTGMVNYNGPATIGLKTELAMERASGIMIWTVTDDTTDETSLLRAIQAALQRG